MRYCTITKRNGKFFLPVRMSKKCKWKKKSNSFSKRCDVKTNEDEDDDSLKILLLKLFFLSLFRGVSFHRRFIIFHFFYLLLDGLRSNGRLNNFINTPIKKGGWRRRRKKSLLGRNHRSNPRDISGDWNERRHRNNWNLYSSANFLTSLLFFDASFVFIRIWGENDKQFFFSLTYLLLKLFFRIIMLLKSLNFSY